MGSREKAIDWGFRAVVLCVLYCFLNTERQLLKRKGHKEAAPVRCALEKTERLEGLKDTVYIQSSWG